MSAELSPVSPAHARMLEALLSTRGEFVNGKELCRLGGIRADLLQGWIRQIKARRPELNFEGKRGFGYRVLAENEELKARRAQIEPMNQRFAKTLALVELLPSATADIVKLIALESGERVEETVERLVAYGCEVHRDLVAAGENPLGLRRLGS